MMFILGVREKSFDDDEMNLIINRYYNSSK